MFQMAQQDLSQPCSREMQTISAIQPLGPPQTWYTQPISPNSGLISNKSGLKLLLSIHGCCSYFLQGHTPILHYMTFQFYFSQVSSLCIEKKFNCQNSQYFMDQSKHHVFEFKKLVNTSSQRKHILPPFLD